MDLRPERRRARALMTGCLVAAQLALVPLAHAEPSHAVTIRSTPKYGPDFTHFGYVNPDAAKGGTVRLSSIGTFDSLNPYILKGVSAAGLALTYDTLFERSLDEPNSFYGLVAKSVEVAPDGRSVTFVLREEARFQDGSPIQPEDVVFSLAMLHQHGRPFYRAYYANIVNAEAVGVLGVRFNLSEGVNQELPAILSELPVLPRLYWQGKDFSATTLESPLGSGPYRIESVEAGRSIVYQRVEDYWAKDLPVNRGRYNFDRIRFDYYRDDTIALEAFKAGEFDMREERNSKLWATGYDGPALAAGTIVKELRPHELPAGMQGFVFNTRRPYFRDPRVREALAYAFDFEWANKNLFYGQYERTTSYFENSELAAVGLPSPGELELLGPWRDEVPPRVFTELYAPPSTAGDGGVRANLRKAKALLGEAGWTVRDGKLVDPAGKPFEFQFLLSSPAFERVVLPFGKNLERLGIEMDVRTVDTAQYQKRMEEYDFDMAVMSFGQSLSPGNEQRSYWTTLAADTPGTRNVAGVRDPVVDALVDELIAADGRPALIDATRALDRVLAWSHYVIPNWHIDAFRIAYWNKFARPETPPRYGLGFLDTWWVDPAQAAAVAPAQGRPGD